MNILYSLVCAFLFCTAATAQSLLPELQNKAIKSVSATPVSSLDDLQEGEWYFMVNEATNWNNPTGLSSYAYDDGSGLSRGANGSTISANMLTSNCGNGLFRITDKKTAQVGDKDAIGFHMQWGTGNYTVWPLQGTTEVHGGKMWAISDLSTQADHRTWVYAVPVQHNSLTWFQLMRNTNSQFTSTWSDLGENGKNIMISGHKGNGDVSDYSYNTTVVVNESSSASALFWKIYKVELMDLTKITVQIKHGDEPVQKEFEIYAVPNTTITLRDHLKQYSFVTFEDKQITVPTSDKEEPLDYEVDLAGEAAFPFATSYEELTTANKWQSMFTKYGRMFVHDPESHGHSTRKYPAIDRATFTGLDDHYFWGFVREDRFSPVKIYSKAAGKDHPLYLTGSVQESPLLCPNETDDVNSWITSNWVVEKGKVFDGKQYFGVRAMKTETMRTHWYIQNFQSKGYMVSWRESALQDDGSNILFTSELDTYETLKERALNAPYEAVYSLNKDARKEIRESNANTVDDYKTLINSINDESNTTGLIKWDANKYYFLRNYTPAGQRTYLLGTVNGTNGAAIEITGEDELGNTTDTHMTCSDANTIWQIETKDGGQAATPEGTTGIGVSRTIPRHIKHINSGKYFTGVGNRQLSTSPTDYYFVNLGAGQLFLKNTQYNGSGAQASAHPLSCNGTNGTLIEGGHPNYKNTRDTWYGIEAKTLKIRLNEGNDHQYYATGHFPFAISIPAEETSMKAYTVSNISETGHMNLEEATGEIPAGTGLIFIGSNATSKVNIIAGSTGVAEADPILKGVNMAETFGDNIAKADVLVLGQDTDGNVGFYKPGSAMTGLRSNSAYILVSDVPAGSGANGLKFNFGGIANGIDGVNADSDNSQVIYDLQGRRVNKLSKGLYIVNGKKVIR